MSKINFAFWGTPDVARETLEILKSAGFLPSLIVTSPDARSGRGMMMQSSPVGKFAEENNIPCLKPEKLGEAEVVLRTFAQRGGASQAISQQENMRSEQNNFRFDLSIVVAYGKIIPEKIINLPQLGSINIHYSPLPKYRGASPVESAILAGETETGVTIQKMAYKMDTGAILAQEKVRILEDETAPELRKRLIKIGGELLVKILPDLVEGKIKEIPQDESEATYCAKLKKEDGLLDLNDDAEKNYNKFRAYAGWPRTYFFENDKRIIITDAALEDDPLDPARGKKFVIKKVIPEGGKEKAYSTQS